MTNDEYKDYIGKEIYAIIDGRTNGIRKSRTRIINANESIGLEATLIEETTSALKLKDISFYMGDNEDSKFKEATINKNYVIGIFKK